MRLLSIAFALMVTACEERRPPAPSAEQNRQMDDAGQMLNEMAANGTARR